MALTKRMGPSMLGLRLTQRRIVLPPAGATLTASAAGQLCTAVPHGFPPNSTFLLRWGDSQNSTHQTDASGGGAWTHTYNAARDYTITARLPDDPATIVASATVTIVQAATTPVEEP